MTNSTSDPDGTTARRTPRWWDEREHAVWTALTTMWAQLDGRLAHELRRDTDLSPSDYAVLAGLAERCEGRVRAHELGTELQWEKSRLSKQITRMEERGLVARESCPTDARGSFVVLTAHGREVIGRAAPLYVAHVRTLLFESLDAAQVEQLAAICAAITSRLACDGADLCET